MTYELNLRPLARLACLSLIGSACVLFAGCSNDSGVTDGATTGASTGGSTGGATGGSTGGATGGSTGGATGGSTGGATGGSTGGATGGSTGGATGGGTGGTCKPGDTAATCPSISAYYPVVNVLVDGVPSETIPAGQAFTLSWLAVNGPADPVANEPLTCVASGAWSGVKAASGSVVLPGQPNGVYNLVLTCTNSFGPGGGSATLNVATTADPSKAPTVTIQLDGKPAETVVPGAPATLSWSVDNSADTVPGEVATCVASGAWSGSKATSGSAAVSQTVPALYSYTLQCSNSFGSSAQSAVLNVANGTLAICDLNDTKCLTYYAYVNCAAIKPGTVFKTLESPNATESFGVNPPALFCNKCSVDNAGNVILPTAVTPATIKVGNAALRGGEYLMVKDQTTVYPAGTPVGFVVSATPDSPIFALGLLPRLTVTSVNNGVDNKGASNGLLPQLFVLDIFKLLSNDNLSTAIYTPDKPFDAVKVTLGGLIEHDYNLDVYAAGVCVPY